MGFNFRKSFKLGPAHVNVSKSGVGYSIGTKGFRFTKSAGHRKKKRHPLWEALKGLFFLAAIVVLITLIVEHKTFFIILAILAAIALVAYLFYVYRQLHPTRQELPPVAEDSTKE